MLSRYVIDTNCLINYFFSVFGEKDRLSTKTRNIIEKSFTNSGDVYLVIPSIVLVEIYYKWFTTEEFASKFYYEVYIKIVNSQYIEIKSIEQEVLENLIKIGGSLNDHDLNDKIILASAMMLDCPLITYDQKLINYVSLTKVITDTLA